MRRVARALVTRARELAVRLSARRVGVAVVFHRVGDPPDDPHGRPPRAGGTALFEARVRALARRHRLVRASELPAAVAARRRGGRVPAALTFDDDLRCHLDVAAPVLRRRGAPATFFLTGAGRAFWWERVDRALSAGLALDDPRLPATTGGVAAAGE